MYDRDPHFLKHALELAKHGLGRVEPNPLVGAVVVRHGLIIGEGWHEKYGGPHAEIHALQQAGESARGATLYVSLEPCCHHGKTPPCTDRIIAAGIRRVVAAMPDPFPAVSGQGFERLRAAGIEVDVGILEEQARRLNRPYLTLLAKGRPYIHLKWAMSLDGKIATRTGHSRWISGEESRAVVHALRGRMDAILVGAGTQRGDDPLLTVRPPGPRTPTRIVVCNRTPIGGDCRLFQTIQDAPVLVAVPQGRYRGALPEGVERVELNATDRGVHLPDLFAELGRRRMTHVLVEGGSQLAGSLADLGLIDEVHVFIAAKLIGGDGAPSPLGGIGIERMDQSRLRLSECTWKQLGADLYCHAFCGLEPKAIDSSSQTLE